MRVDSLEHVNRTHTVITRATGIGAAGGSGVWKDFSARGRCCRPGSRCEKLSTTRLLAFGHFADQARKVVWVDGLDKVIIEPVLQ